MNNIMINPTMYPLGAFNLRIRNVVCEIQRNIQAPDAMIGLVTINGMSTACQSLIDVVLPNGQKRPASVWGLCVGESGERKSTLDALIFSPPYENDRLKAVAFQAALDSYYVTREVWKVENQGFSSRIANAIRKGELTETIQMEMGEHAKSKPKKPRLRRFMRQNITTRALMDALEGNGESIAIATDEGEVMFKSGAMAQLGFLNKTWDGAPMLALDRADLDHVLVMNPRVTISIMTQKAVLQAYLQKHGDIARGSGHWARYLVAWPTSTQGFRSVNWGELVWEHLPIFQARMKELLNKYEAMIESGEVKRELVEFSDDAKARWFDLAQRTEWMLQPGDYLHDIHDYASKVMEIMARLAAVMHYFNGEEGKISLDTLERAYTIMHWHVDEYKRLFSPQFTLSQEQVDAQAVASYLRGCIWRGPSSNTFIPKNHVLHNGPVRQRDRLNAALRILENQGAVWIVVPSKTKRRFVQLSDPFFASI